MILKKLFSIPEFRKSKIILFYASFDGEVDTFEMMKQALKLGKKIALPAIIQKKKKIIPALIQNPEHDLDLGPYGIKQPRFDKSRRIPLDEIDMVIVPGVAFDKRNYRLGRGEGYYDRFLKNLTHKIPSIGLAFDFQILDFLPIEKHDIPVSRIIVN